MSWGIVASVGGTLVGGMIASDSAEDAADAQAGAAAASDATQRYFYDTTRADNAPFRETGVAANNRLAYLMGLPPGDSSGGAQAGAASPYSKTAPDTYVAGQSGNALWEKVLAGFNASHQSNFGTPMNRPWGADADAQRSKADLDAQYQAALAADPAQQASQKKAQQAQATDPEYGSLNRNFSRADLNSDPVLNAAPGYMTPMHDFGRADLANDLVYQNGLQFGLDEGSKAINRQAAAGGGFLSGAALKALTRFGNDYGTTKTAGAYDRFTNDQNTKYGLRNDSFNRFNTNQDRTYNKLASMSGAGQQATNQVSAAGQNAGNNISASQQGMGNALASSYLTQGNAWQNALNQGASALKNGSGYSQSPNFFDGTGAWRA